MQDQTSNSELKDSILEKLTDISIKYAAHTAPLYSITDILSLKDISSLRKLGSVCRVKYYNKLQKPDLVSNIADKLLRPELLRSCLYCLDEIEWKFFQQAAVKKLLQTEKAYIDFYHTTQDLGLIQSFYYDGKLLFVVPDEIKAVYKQLCETDFKEEKRFRDILNNYAIAAVSLYGVISKEDFVELFNSQNNRKIDILDVSTILESSIYTDSEYCFWDEYIVDASFEDDNFSNVKVLLALRKGKSRYSPSKEELLNYSDPDFYERTSQINALESHLLELIPDRNEVLDIIDGIHDLTISEARFQTVFDLLDSHGVVFESTEKVNKTIKYIIDVQNNTRLWSNFGYTPNELSKLKNLLLKPLSSNQGSGTYKIGRNSPCPCGSGKKYKNCCGKSIS